MFSATKELGPMPDAFDVRSSESMPHSFGLGKTAACPLVLDLNPEYRGREWTETERQHVEACPFCQVWTKRFERLRSEVDDANSILTLLEDVGAVECDFDYGLPSGKRSDTFVDVSKLCLSEESMRRVATAF